MLLLVNQKAFFALHSNAARPLEESNLALSLLYTDQHWTGMLLSKQLFLEPFTPTRSK